MPNVTCPPAAAVPISVVIPSNPFSKKLVASALQTVARWAKTPLGRNADDYLTNSGERLILKARVQHRIPSGQYN
jgi:hypothetical protein